MRAIWTKNSDKSIEMVCHCSGIFQRFVKL
jgi:hypothetical protein